MDVYAIGDRRKKAVKIEVKTSQQTNFVTGISQKGLADNPLTPDFWVLCQMKEDTDGVRRERFFVLSHKEICRAQFIVNRTYAKRYEERHGHAPDMGRGVDNVRLQDVERYEDAWVKITRVLT
ncbi:MAG: hypothetical protein V2A79_13590 [Planctomycetota bacterium]